MKLRIDILEDILVFLFLFLLPTQLGKHFFLSFSYINGIKIDYLAPAIYITDLLVLPLLLLHHTIFLAHLKKYKIAFFIFGFLFAINIIQSPQPILALYSLLKIIEVYFIFFIFRRLNLSIIAVTTPLLCGAVFELLLALFQFTHNHSAEGLFYYFGERLLSISTPGIAKAQFLDRQILRPYATFSHPNSLGGFYLLVYSLCLLLIRFAKTYKEKLITLILWGFSTALLVISFSKVVILAYVGITMLFFIDRYNNIKKDGSCVMCIVARLIVPCILALIFLQTQSDPDSLSKRIMFLQQSAHILSSTYFLGTGFGQYLYWQSTFPSPYPYFFLQPVHNIFILFLLQAGFVTTIFTLYCGIWFLRRYYRQIWFIFLVIFATGLFDHYWITLQQNMLILGVVFGIATRIIDRRLS